MFLLVQELCSMLDQREVVQNEATFNESALVGGKPADSNTRQVCWRGFLLPAWRMNALNWWACNPLYWRHPLSLVGA